MPGCSRATILDRPQKAWQADVRMNEVDARIGRPVLEQYAEFIEGRADAETRDRIGAMLRDEQSELLQFVDLVVHNSEAMTSWN